MSAGGLKALAASKGNGNKIACVTAYDAAFAKVAAAAGIDAILVGDSLGMVLHGEQDTLRVRLADMTYHSRITRAGAGAETPLITDMPFASACTAAQALGSAVQLVRDGRCDMVKLEGGEERSLRAVRAITAEGIPVCGHLGMLPQSVLARGGYQRVAADADTRQLMAQAAALQEAGATMLVLECVPRELAARVTATLDVPVIGIGAGADCDGQVLVLHDLLGLNPNPPFFSKDFLRGEGSVLAAIQNYARQVRDGEFPQAQHGYGETA